MKKILLGILAIVLMFSVVQAYYDDDNDGWIIVETQSECYDMLQDGVPVVWLTTNCKVTTGNYAIYLQKSFAEEMVLVFELAMNDLLNAVNEILNLFLNHETRISVLEGETTTTTPITTTTTLPITTTTPIIGCPCDFIKEDNSVCCPSDCQPAYYCRADIYRIGRYQRSENLNQGQCKSVNPSQYSIKLYGVCG